MKIWVGIGVWRALAVYLHCISRNAMENIGACFLVQSINIADAWIGKQTALSKTQTKPSGSQFYWQKNTKTKSRLESPWLKPYCSQRLLFLQKKLSQLICGIRAILGGKMPKKKHKDLRYFRPDRRGPEFPMVETNLHHCASLRCKGLVNKNKEHSPYCSKHRYSNFRDAHPLACAYHNLRHRARQRGHEFTLTFEEYVSFAVRTNYGLMKGRTTMSLSVDRIDDTKGYNVTNIRALRLGLNSRKSFVPFFAHQQENISYEPSAEEIAAVEAQMREQNGKA